MKLSLMVTCLFIFSSAISQNVGIGVTGTPSEKLDVNGNLNVSGTIKANGTDGTAGQVLMKNNSGALSWGDVGDFKNVATFTDTSTLNINWNVPSGVTKIWVELWGGGGAGLFTGGGGGGYMSLLFTVTPAQSILVTVGKAGRDVPNVQPSFTSAQGGGDSRIDISSQYYIASGGSGGFTSTVFSFPQYTPGIGGGYITSVSATTSPRGPFYAQSGENGGLYRNEYNYYGSSTQYFRLTYYGDGGAAANTANYNARGAYEENTVITTTGSATRTLHNPARPGTFPGGGGGGGPQLVNDGRSGANGLVLIHY